MKLHKKYLESTLLSYENLFAEKSCCNFCRKICEKYFTNFKIRTQIY